LKIVGMKGFTSYLIHERGLLTSAENPVTDIKTPQSVDESRRQNADKAFSKADYLAARSHVVGTYRDVMTVQAGTGAHVTEVHRFATGHGHSEPYPEHGVSAAESAGVLVFAHKSGAPHKVPVSQEVLDAAQRLQKTGGFSTRKYTDVVHDACVAAG